MKLKTEGKILSVFLCIMFLGLIITVILFSMSIVDLRIENLDLEIKNSDLQMRIEVLSEKVDNLDKANQTKAQE